MTTVHALEIEEQASAACGTAIGPTDGSVLVIGSGQQRYRQYLLRGLSERVQVWLIDEVAPTWQAKFAKSSSALEALETESGIPDQQRVTEAVLALVSGHRVAGVVTYDETLVVAAAQVADALGLPGLTPAGAESCRNKHRTRQLLTAAGLPQPRFALAESVAEACRAANEIGFPVVLKPRGMGGSIGVVRADSPAEVEEAFGIARRASRSGPRAYERGVLIEELVTGPEISVDGVTAAGDYRSFCIAHKEVGFPPFFEEVGHTVDGADPLLDDPEVQHVLTTAHRALGIAWAMTHTELRLTERGPVIIEVNGRVGGDLIPYLGMLATGIDPGQVAAQVAVGQAPRLETSSRRCAGIRFLYPPEDCTVLDVSLPSPHESSGLIEAASMVCAGAKLRLPPRAHLARYAYLIATGADRAACTSALERAQARTSITSVPLGPPTTQERPW